jgi:hypothetical protein
MCAETPNHNHSPLHRLLPFPISIPGLCHGDPKACTCLGRTNYGRGQVIAAGMRGALIVRFGVPGSKFARTCISKKPLSGEPWRLFLFPGAMNYNLTINHIVCVCCFPDEVMSGLASCLWFKFKLSISPVFLVSKDVHHLKTSYLSKNSNIHSAICASFVSRAK